MCVGSEGVSVCSVASQLQLVTYLHPKQCSHTALSRCTQRHQFIPAQQWEMIHHNSSKCLKKRMM